MLVGQLDCAEFVRRIRRSRSNSDGRNSARNQVGMLRKQHKNLFINAISALKASISNGHVISSSTGPCLLFLCGANKADGQLSARRAKVKEFIESRLDYVRVVIAEDVYTELIKHGKAQNLYALETQISLVSDYILIILEGFGSYCELGAFAHTDFRKKVKVVNNIDFIHEKSFINVGCIDAIQSEAGKDSIFYYPMDDDGVESQDRIADIFPKLNTSLSNFRSKQTKPSCEQLAPLGGLEKQKVLFLHDLIYMLGPVSNVNLVKALKHLFGNHDYRLHKDILAILIGANLIRYKSGLYFSLLASVFYEYGLDQNDLAISFRLYSYKRQSI